MPGNFTHLSKKDLSDLKDAAKVYVRLMVKVKDTQGFDMTWTEIVEEELEVQAPEGEA